MKKITILCFTIALSMSSLFASDIPVATGSYRFDPSETNDSIKFETNQTYYHTFYVDAETGADSNDGLSLATALKTLDKLAQQEITFGDQILLKGGLRFKGCINLINLNETLAENTRDTETPRIHIGSYGGRKAIIDCAGYAAGIWIENTSCVDVSDLKITGNGGTQKAEITQRYGVSILSSSAITNSLVHDITIYNVDIYDVFLLNPVANSRACNQWDMNDAAGWGWGIFGRVEGGKGIHDANIRNVDVRNVSEMGIRFKGKGKIDGTPEKNCDKVQIQYCHVFQTGGPGMQFNRCNHSSMLNCRITESGNRNDNRKWGRGSGMWTWGSVDFLLEHNTFEGAQGIADCCGAHIDFNCTNVVIQNCISRYNAGGFIEVLGLNYNCCYRYNVSINDGWRNLDDPAQAFWGEVGNTGCILTVNGHNGDKQYKGPYQTYIYNNTVINTTNDPYKNPFVFNIATSNVGLVIMNNIFWIPEQCKSNWSMHKWKDGKPYEAANDFMISDSPKSTSPDANGTYYANTRKMTETEIAAMNVVMKNNIYKKNILPENYWDEQPFFVDPLFADVNGYEAADFVPSNSTAIKKGMEIPKLETDLTDYGITFGGLKVTKDFFGNPITGNIIGAIVPNAKQSSVNGSTQTSVKEMIKASEKCFVYPNPVKEILSVSKSINDTNFVLFSMGGTILKKGEIIDNSINVSHLKKGCYLLRVGNNVPMKFIKV